MPTLSRIENNKMAPTFSVLLKVMTGLKLSWQSLMEAPGAPNSDEQIDVAVPADWETTSIAGYTYVLPHSGSSLSRVVQPLMFDVDARSLEEAGGLAGHQGIEFCFVISGKLQLHFAGQAPKELPTGGTALFNCAHPHAYVAKGRGKTRVLNIVVKDPLLTLDEAESPFEQRIKQISRST
jgi:hypothetical protein